MGAYRDALLDAIDAKAELVAAAGGLADDFGDELDLVVARAARRGATEDDVRLELERHFGRILRAAHARVALGSLVLIERTSRAQEDAIAVDGRAKREGPIRRLHLEERRARRRADSLARFDAAELPDLEDLVDMEPRRLAALMRRLGVQLEEKGLTEAVVRATRRVLGTGIPDDALLESVAKAAKGSLRQSLMVATKNAIRAIELAKHKASRRDQMIWVSVLDNRTCDSCEERHGETMSLAEWEREGMPGSAALLCDGNCRCELQPAEHFAEEVEGEVSVELELETERD